MQHFKFKFKYESETFKASGNGTCRAESLLDAIEVAKKGVANDFGSSPDLVFITNISVYKPRKRKSTIKK